MTQLIVCVFVAGFSGGSAWCESDPDIYPIGVCHSTGDNIIYCTADITDFIGVASFYDPARGKINCYHDPLTNEDTCDKLGDGTPTETAYGWAMACPVGMLNTKIEFVHDDTGQNLGVWECRDHGGAIHPTFGKRWTGTEFINTWYIPYDFLLHNEEWWAYGTVRIKNIELPSVNAEKQEINAE